MEDNNLIFPNYNHCVLNSITSILRYYNIESNHTSLESLDKILAEKKYRNIVFLLLDGMGEHILNNISKDGYFNQKKIDIVTSVYPSTTTAALTSYYSGKAPYETGWIAWSQYFKEYGRALDMFSHKESYLGDQIKKPMREVFSEDMKYESVFEKIENQNPNVRAYAIQPDYAERRGKRQVIANDIDEIVTEIKDVCSIEGEKFIFAYSDNPDGILHRFGTDSKEASDFLLETEEKVKNLRQELGDDTIIIVSADHGHKNIDKVHSILDFPELMECLIIPPSLECRFLSFWVKEDMKETFEQRFNSVLKDEYWLMTKKELLEEYKLLGEGKKHKKIDDFIGNYVAISIAGSMIRLETYLAEGKPIRKSTHCGLTKDEMEVPVIVLK